MQKNDLSEVIDIIGIKRIIIEDKQVMYRELFKHTNTINNEKRIIGRKFYYSSQVIYKRIVIKHYPLI